MTSIGVAAASVGIGLGQSVYNSVAGQQGLARIMTPDGKTQLVMFDLSTQESYTQGSQPTGFSIETGGVIADHIIVAPLQIDLTCMVTDTPITGIDALLTDGITSAVNATTGPLGVVVASAGYAAYQYAQSNIAFAGGSKAASRSVQAYNRLRALQTGNDGASPIVPFTLITKVGTFTNMVISMLSAPRAKDTGDALVFNLSCVQVTLVSSQTIDVTVNAKSPTLANGKQDLGDQQPEAIDKTIFTQGENAGIDATNTGINKVKSVYSTAGHYLTGS